jgi:hypothetical protein
VLRIKRVLRRNGIGNDVGNGVGDDDVGVEKSSKMRSQMKNEKCESIKRRKKNH